MKSLETDNRIQCRSEYDTLHKVLVVKPSFMEITEVINETQKHYQNQNINIPLAQEQHEQFVRVLQDQHVEVEELSPDPALPEQVFTRDIGFALHDELYVASMSETIRQPESETLKRWLEANEIPYHNEFPSSIEGGDVIVHGTTIFVGQSGRTSMEAIEALQDRLPSYKVVALPLHESILHLDCVFNIVDEETALVYPSAFTPEGLGRISSMFNLIRVTRDEQFQMGPNVLSIGDKMIISLPQNDRMNRILEEKGFHVIPVDFSEIIKSGGSFRCCTLPLRRG
ncbi:MULTISPECIES: dimethylarginine dimethylaminohydrolase family protein [Pontibacillus]|uniref:Arginine deiminase family protein n=1 Tax=Pontibacillus chungwhensis TaxID=265426 RepID=A0ABY8V0D8_9BACI|nr:MULTISPECIES: arginine deiminase family protein [Pontibacillus]MCD5322108.1 arginine deiminase family protein [Pontibacillus sp. HN14]WIF99407.1 arginine deiminase family protein [Pontibacillus chungwhensis]